MGDLEAFLCPTAVTFACFLMSQCAAALRVKELLTVPRWWSAHIPLLPLTQWECKSEVLPSHLHLWNLLEAHGETKIHRCRSRMRRWRTASRTRARRLLARSLATLETYFPRVVWLCRFFSKWLLLLKKTPVVVFRANLHLERLHRFCANISPFRCLHQFTPGVSGAFTDSGVARQILRWASFPQTPHFVRHTFHHQLTWPIMSSTLRLGIRPEQHEAVTVSVRVLVRLLFQVLVLSTLFICRPEAHHSHWDVICLVCCFKYRNSEGKMI